MFRIRKGRSMGMKDDVKKVIDDVKDTVKEAAHRSTAEAEKSRRAVDGENMTAGEKAGSAINEAKNRIEAGIDAAKRKIRDKT